MTATQQTKSLQTKQSSEWTNDEGTTFPAGTLYRFVDGNGDGPGVWYARIEQAETSWQRWLESAPARARRAAEAKRYREAVAAHDAREASGDPFAGLT